MDAERHALLARRLIDACGGPVRAAEFCRIDKSHLSRIGQTDNEHFMPADVMADLERACGQPIYSRAIADDATIQGRVECLVSEGMVTTEAAAELQREIRAAAKDGEITPREAKSLRKRIVAIQEQLREVDDAIAGAST